MVREKKARLLRITTVPLSLRHLLSGQLTYFTNKEFDVLAVSASGSEIVDGKIDGIAHRTVEMTRRITPFRDLLAVFQLIIIIRQFKPDIIHTHTPKAGLLGMLAGWMCRVPIRLHTVAGLPLMKKSGTLRSILVVVEKLTYRLATGVYPNSEGLKKYIMEEIDSKVPLRVIGKGSSNGIDTWYFSRREFLEAEAALLRKKYGIGEDDIVYSFVGRVVRDKGISELVEAYKKCRQYLPTKKNLYLLIVGPMEQDLDPISSDDMEFLSKNRNVVLAGYQSDVRPWIMASDIFVFPSYREGFPNVVMQASSLEVPCIVSDINGCNEIIEDNKTGVIVKPKDAEGLYNAMAKLSTNESLRRQLGREAMKKIVRDYDQKFVWEELHKEYEAQLREKKLRERQNLLYRNAIKPFLDKFVALIILLVTSPIMLVCMALLARANYGRIWFTQTRPGLHGKLFKVIKFRTMSDDYNEYGELLPDEDRLHAVGKFVRKTSLDELPQLINVLKGDMSIVGPRPLLEEYLPLYSAEQKQRHDVRPGITGWAQVNGRNTISWRQKFAYDVWYVKNQSFALDLKILFLTVIKVFKAEGISSGTSVTMEKFRGNS